MAKGLYTFVRPCKGNLLDQFVYLFRDKVEEEINVTVSTADMNDGWQSLSCLTDSTEQSAPVNFDMSNRVSIIILSFS